MNITTLRSLVHTRTGRWLLCLSGLYIVGWLLFRFWIEPDATKTPGEPGMWGRDFLWIVYWRWYLDWPMIGGCAGSLLLVVSSLNLLQRKLHLSTESVTIYLVPLIVMGANYVGMLAIDIAVTIFADFYINGTWVTPDRFLFNLTAQQLYHGFFFWFMPMLLIVGLPTVCFVHQSTHRYHIPLRMFSILMAGYALCLGFLDPVVCAFIWDDWRIFGDWSMMGYDPMWAEGWIAHYVLLAIIWVILSFVIRRLFRDLLIGSSSPAKV